MALFRRSRVRELGRGRFRVQLPEPERELVASLVEQLRELLTHSAGDLPVLRRLFPTAYHEDAERDREFQQLVRDDLLERRLAALDVVEQTLTGEEELDEAQLTAWMTALNDLRLVLGTRLDVGEEPVEIDEDDPDAGAYVAYDYLGYLVGEVVDVLSGTLPPPADSGR